MAGRCHAGALLSEHGEKLTGRRFLFSWGVISRLLAAQQRQSQKVISDLVRVRGLMPLLMKSRNGVAWTAEEKSELLMQLRILSRISPYLLLLLLPGSALFLPLYAWWLDNRSQSRSPVARSAR